VFADQLKIACGNPGFHGTQIENSCNTDLLSVNMKVTGVGVDPGIILKKNKQELEMKIMVWFVLFLTGVSWRALVKTALNLLI
jgi:hypothetical protein